MTWIILTIIFVALGVGLIFAGKVYEFPGKWIGTGVLVCWLLATVFFFMMKTVPSGDVGVVRSFGVVDGQRGSGVEFILPWQTLERQNVKIQHANFTGATRIAAASQDTQDVFFDATLNYSLSEAHVQELLRNVGSNWFQTLVVPRVFNDVKELTTKYSATDVVVHREDIRQAAKVRLQDELGQYSITVQDFLITNVDFDQAFKAAIEAKQAAAQHALQVTNDAQAVVNQAQGDATATKTRADAQAQANAELVQSLGGPSAYIAFLQAQNWKPTVIGGNAIVNTAGS